MKLYIDCTLTYERKITTGIQRVVKKIVQFDPGDSDIQLIPVRFDGYGFLEVTPDSLRPNLFSKFIQVCRNILVKTWLYTHAKGLYNSLIRFQAYIRHLFNKSKYVQLTKENVILVADLIHSERYVKKLIELKSSGFKIYQVAYDLLPITYPQFFEQVEVDRFRKIAQSWPEYSTKVYAISKKVANEVSTLMNIQNVDFFHLGSDFMLKDTAGAALTEFPKDSYYLSVGTIEPRKNHIHIMKSFIKLWESGSTEKLVFIGRVGWRMEETLKLLNKLQDQYQDRFIWLSNAGDDELEAYYQNAKAVICASYDEGYGLPLVEALAKGVNVICSDIEVFREVGGPYCTYFDFEGGAENSLFKIIEQQRHERDLTGFKQLTWNSAISNLLNKITEDAGQRRNPIGL